MFKFKNNNCNCSQKSIENFNFQHKQKSQHKNQYQQNLIQQSIKNIGQSWEIKQKDIPQVEEQKNNQNQYSDDEDDEQFQTLPENCVFMMNFNNNGSIFAFSTENSIVNFYDMQNRQIITQLSDHKEIVTNLEWFKSDDPYQNQNDNKLITCSLDKTIKIWDDYKCIQTLEGHSDWLRCISISKNNNYLTSGCVSSQVVTWDLNRMEKINSISHDQGQDFLNTINVLNFKNQDNNIFLCGTRDGYIRMYDVRTNQKTLQWKSHNNKLNSGQFTSNDVNILSSGRDNSIRFWDTRFIVNQGEFDKNEKINGFVQEYQQHKCSGYNIQSHFMNQEKYIITGSEDYSVVIYNTLSGEAEKILETKNKVNHLVKPVPNSNNIQFALSGLQENSIHFYEPVYSKAIEKQKKEKENPNINVDKPNPLFDESEILEDAMSEYGDVILKIFHKNNYTYSKQMGWEDLIELVQKSDDQESKDILQKFQNLIYQKLNEYMIQAMTGQIKPKKNQSLNNQQNQQNLNQNTKCKKCQFNKQKLKQAQQNQIQQQQKQQQSIKSII